MALMRAPDCRDRGMMTGGGQPVQDLGTNCAALRPSIGSFDRARLARHQQDGSRPDCACLCDTAHQAVVCCIEIVAMKIKRDLRLQLACLEPAIPMRVQPTILHGHDLGR